MCFTLTPYRTMRIRNCRGVATPFQNTVLPMIVDRVCETLNLRFTLERSITNSFGSTCWTNTMSILQHSFTGSHHESTIYMMKMSMTDKPFQQFHVLRVLKGKHTDNQTLYKCTIEECPAMFTVERVWGSKTLHVNTIRDHDFSYSMPQQVRLKRSMSHLFWGGHVYACDVCLVFSDFRTHNYLLNTSQYYTLNVVCVCVWMFDLFAF